MFLQSIILCDRVYKDLEATKMVIAGTFNKVMIGEAPSAIAEGASLYLAFRDIREATSVTVEYVDVCNNKTLLTLPAIKLRPIDPAETCEQAVFLPELPIPREGVYAFDVFNGANFLGTFRLIVLGEDFH